MTYFESLYISKFTSSFFFLILTSACSYFKCKLLFLIIWNILYRLVLNGCICHFSCKVCIYISRGYLFYHDVFTFKQYIFYIYPGVLYESGMGIPLPWYQYYIQSNLLTIILFWNVSNCPPLFIILHCKLVSVLKLSYCT